jgi:hypothetical protein
MSGTLYRNTVTIECVTDEPILPSTPLAEISYAVCTHLWPELSKSIRSRPMTRAEVAALERLPERDQVRMEPSYAEVYPPLAAPTATRASDGRQEETERTEDALSVASVSSCEEVFP